MARLRFLKNSYSFSNSNSIDHVSSRPEEPNRSSVVKAVLDSLALLKMELSSIDVAVHKILRHKMTTSAETSTKDFKWKWRQVALVLDRFFVFLYMMFALISLTFLLPKTSWINTEFLRQCPLSSRNTMEKRFLWHSKSHWGQQWLNLHVNGWRLIHQMICKCWASFLRRLENKCTSYFLGRPHWPEQIMQIFFSHALSCMFAAMSCTCTTVTSTTSEGWCLSEIDTPPSFFCCDCCHPKPNSGMVAYYEGSDGMYGFCPELVSQFCAKQSSKQIETMKLELLILSRFLSFIFHCRHQKQSPGQFF